MSNTIVIPKLDRGDTDHGGSPSDDRLSKVVQAALAVYLLPAFVVVMTVGGVMLVTTKAVRAGSAAAKCLGLTRRGSPVIAPWPKRVKAPVSGSVCSVRHAHVSKHGSNPWTQS